MRRIEQVFKLLNMSSTPTDDRTTKARIRDAAIECVATYGVAATTVRKVAEAADVAPGSVIHHFGSMEELRFACDTYIAASIREYKRSAIAQGSGVDLTAAIQNSDIGSMGGYLAQVLAEDSPTVAKLVDDLVGDAEVYMEQAVETGMARPTDDPRGRAAILMLWSLGALVMHKHMQRLLGFDITDPESAASPALGAYAAPAYEILGEGIFTPSFSDKAREAFSAMSEKDRDDKK